jgi:tetratricopeptide (TPR) repeat protein
MAQACIWDRDTLAMERAKFPEVNELIVGYFPRHSAAYYQWRMEQVLAIPVEDRTPSDYDDLGASYDKLGQHQDAIDTMHAKFERYPDEALYETHANLGTFYIHNGDLEQGVQYIGSAIEINPDAHFGREVYQKLLVEYVIQQRAKGNTLPLEKDMSHPFEQLDGGFPSYVIKAKKHLTLDDREAQSAIKGILGMMRFGNYDSPILLEVLGDFLHTRYEGEQGMQRLAARAYLKASFEVEETAAVLAYRKKAETALDMQGGVDLASIEADLRKEIAEGDAYFAQIEADEKRWIEAGKDVDAMFIEKYYDNPPEYGQSVLAVARDRFNSLPISERLFYILISIGVICFISLVVLVRRIRKMRARSRETVAKLQQV